jgi:hypothetical protein
MATFFTLAFVLMGLGFLTGALFYGRVLSFVLFVVTVVIVLQVADMRAEAFLAGTLVGLAALRYQLPSRTRSMAAQERGQDRGGTADSRRDGTAGG